MITIEVVVVEECKVEVERKILCELNYPIVPWRWGNRDSQKSEKVVGY